MREKACALNNTVVIVILVRVIVVMRHHDQNSLGEERAYLTYCLQPCLKGS